MKKQSIPFQFNIARKYLKKADDFMQEKILVTGASGFLGKKIHTVLTQDYQVTGISKSGQGCVALDVLDQASLQSFIEIHRPDVIVHTIAIADPDICEQNQQLAYATNVTTTRYLCEICAKQKIKLIFISTDYVFDGDSSNEYTAETARKPKNYYGQTKVLAEDEVQKLEDFLIVRVPILYGFNDGNDKPTFVTKAIHNLQQDKELYFDDENFRYPVLIDDVAVGLKTLLPQNPTGIVQFSSSQPTTKYEWAKLIAAEFALNANLIKPQKGTENSADRPKHIKMDTSRMEQFGIKMHDLNTGLNIMHQQMDKSF